jgi:hypothetical protein
MRWRALGIALGVLVYAGLWVVVAAGATALAAPLVLIPVLVVLIAGGNLLSGWLGVPRKPQQFNRPDRVSDEPRGEGRA